MRRTIPFSINHDLMKTVTPPAPLLPLAFFLGLAKFVYPGNSELKSSSFNCQVSQNQKSQISHGYTITYNIIWANQKTKSFEFHWLRALSRFYITCFPAILSGIGRHFKFCQYVNCERED